MRSRFMAIGIAMAVLAVLASSCSKSTTSPAASATSDQGQVNATLTASASLVDDDLGESTFQGSANAARPAGNSNLAGITPYKWWQTVTGVTRSWALTFSDSSTGDAHPNVCIAVLTKHVTGSLVIVPLSDTLSSITKPLDKTYTRSVRLERLLIGGVRFWKVTQVTGDFGTTPSPNNTTQIVSIHLVATGVDTTLTSPAQFFSLSHVIHLAPSDSVHLTVTTTRTNDPVFIHLNGIYRWRLRNNLDGTYSTQWLTSSWPGWRHFGVQAMTHASLYDDTAAFDTQAWHFPFRVTQASVNYYP